MTTIVFFENLLNVSGWDSSRNVRDIAGSISESHCQRMTYSQHEAFCNKLMEVLHG